MPAPDQLTDAAAAIGRVLGEPVQRIEPVARALAGRYFRITVAAGTRLALLAPPVLCGRAARLAGTVESPALRLPALLRDGAGQGVVVFGDPGAAPLAADADFRSANRALAAWHALPRDTAPSIDVTAGIDAFFARHPDAGPLLASVAKRLRDAVAAMPAVFAHGDAAPANVLATPGVPTFLAFEGAGCAPLGWDVACLYRDPGLGWEEDRQLDGVIRYWEEARRAGLPVPAEFGDFYRDVEWLSVLRGMTLLAVLPEPPGDALGAQLRTTSLRYAALAPLARALDALGIGRVSVQGVSF